MNIESQVINVPVENIIPNRFQPRLNFDDTALQELAASIKEHGIIQPLVLRRLGDKYEIIAGERRYKASKMAGLTYVPAIISMLDDKQSAEVAIVENIQRKNLSSIEEAKSYKSLLDKGYLTQEELAKKMGLSQSAISNKLRLLSLSSEVQNALSEGKISERHARSLLQIDIYDQPRWLEMIINERLTVRALDKKIKEEKNKNNGTVETLEIEENINEKAVDNMEIPSNLEMPILNHNNENKIPNKFFNFLEDEQANMSVKESDVEEEEIEMLDFLAPDNVAVVDAPVVNLGRKDMSMANNLVDKLTDDLKLNNYQAIVNKEENDFEVKYTIVINKKEE